MNPLNFYEFYSSSLKMESIYFLSFILLMKIANSNDIITIIDKLKHRINDIKAQSAFSEKSKVDLIYSTAK